MFNCIFNADRLHHNYKVKITMRLSNYADIKIQKKTLKQSPCSVFYGNDLHDSQKVSLQVTQAFPSNCKKPNYDQDKKYQKLKQSQNYPGLFNSNDITADKHSTATNTVFLGYHKHTCCSIFHILGTVN